MTNEHPELGETTASARRRSVFSGIEQRVLKRLRSLELGDCPKIVVGFSGGSDSLCLAAILARLARGGHVQPLLVHVDHGLRPNAPAEFEVVGDLAKHLGLPLRRRTLLPGLADAHHGLGIEEAARRERFSVLADEAAAFDTRVIALAHHQNDQVETILLHLMRGSGLSGVRGMNERSITTVPWWTLDGNQRPEFTIWRPLLAERKQEIEAYSADLGVAPIHDESNDETVFRRNAVRHTVLPAIEAVFPDARSAIVRFAAIVGDEDELLDGVAREALRCAVGNEHELPRRALIAQNVAIQRRIVKLWLKRWITNDALRSERVGAVLELAQANRGGKTIEVGENVTVSLERGSLIARRGRSRSECTKES